MDMKQMTECLVATIEMMDANLQELRASQEHLKEEMRANQELLKEKTLAKMETN
jgi:hypothetical protein